MMNIIYAQFLNCTTDYVYKVFEPSLSNADHTSMV